MKRTCACCSILLLPMLWGCGSGIQEAALLAGESGARTFLDILVSDLIADAPDYFSFPAGPAANDGTGDGTGNGGTNGGNGGTDGGNGGTDLVGDAANGEAIFTSVCIACHCASAASCGSGQVDLEGVTFSRIQEKLQGSGFHAGGKFPDFTEQDLADLAAYLGG